jgi:NAD(P)H-dependent nitrite reductase small subunit
MSESAASAVLSTPTNENASTSTSCAEWTAICPLAAIAPDTGVAALVGGRQIALFRLRDGRVFAIGNRDPFTGAQVLSRGLVGDRGGVAKVASPLHKQSFALATGECLDDAVVRVPIYATRVRDGLVEIAA